MNNTEKARQQIVKYVFLFYWMLIFEGAVRKWFLPQLNQIIFFLRDPVVLAIYFIAWRNNFFPRDKFLTAGIMIALAYIPLIFIQIVTIKLHPLTLIYGWRVYFYYLPLAFVIKETFYQEDINKLFKQTLYIAAPLAILVYIQFISPRDSFINTGFSGIDAFVVSGLIVRTTGTFTFTTGQTFFASSLMAMLAYIWLYRKQYTLMPLIPLIIVTCTAMTHLLLSGSRTAFFMTGLIIVATFFGLLFTNSTKMKFTGSILLIFLILIGIVLFLGPFKDSFEALGQRFENAEGAEGSPIRRAFAPLIIFLHHLTSSPMLGYGVGFGTGGGSQLSLGTAQIALAEDEWSRIILESGPGFGLAYILYRIVFTFHLGLLSLQSAMKNNNLLPIMLLGFIGFHTLAGQISQNGTIMGYNWLFVGLIMAAAAQKQHSTTTSSIKTLIVPNFPKIINSVKDSAPHYKTTWHIT
ncbi:MAG: hypothetical protein WC782_04010 [Methylococcaceae bacterium]|jgi:hypothetical protein